MAGLVLDLFAGMGGWSVAAHALDLTEIGIELDLPACATRAAAGHRTIRADVASFPLGQLDGKVDGIIASPPCTDWSMSGKRAGLDGDTGALVLEVDRWVRALRPRWVACEQVPPALEWWNRFALEWKELGYHTWAGVLNSADYGVPQTRQRAILIASLDHRVGPPERTHEQNPTDSLFGEALPKWMSMAEALGWGSAGTYPTVTAPSGGGRSDMLGGSGARERLREDMAEAGYEPRGTGWFDPNDQPAPTVCGRGAPRWAYERDTPAHERMARGKSVAERLDDLGAESFAFGDIRPNAAVRDQDEPAPTIMAASDNGNYQFRVGFPRLDDIGDSPDGYRERDWRESDEPAFVVTEKARSWVIQPTELDVRPGPNAGNVPRAVDEPAPTIREQSERWHFVEVDPMQSEESGRIPRAADEPAPTVTQQTRQWEAKVTGLNTGRDWKPGGTRDDAQTIPIDQPAPALDSQGNKMRWQTLVEDGVWPEERPATTVAGDTRLAPPGHRGWAPDDPNPRTRQFPPETTIRLEIGDALILQSFRPDYPVVGTKSKQFQQVGNAIPPLLAWHVLKQVIGE